MSSTFKAGDKAIYSEARLYLLVEVERNDSYDDVTAYALRVLGVVSRHAYPVGTPLVVSKTGHGQGLWYLRSIEEFRRQHTELAGRIDALLTAPGAGPPAA